MISGLLKDKVTILTAKTTADALGYQVETWISVGTVWGNLVEEKGKEILQNDRPVSFRRALLFIRYRKDVGVQNRMKINGTTWEVESCRVMENCRRTGGLELVLRAND
jgi:SPP1 family predicted phage head-tail adaptor